MNDVLKRLTPLIRSVQLQGIRLVESSCRGFTQEPTESSQVDVRFNWSAKAVLKSAGSFSVLADMEVLLVPTGSEDANAARIWSRFEIRYSVPQEIELNEGLLEEFAKSNGVFNAWAYWREFIQSTLVRMGLPAVLLPLYRTPMAVPEPGAPAKSSE